LNKPHSIKQNSHLDVLPNFRNLGVTMRIILTSNLLALFLALLQADSWADFPQRMMLIATLLTPVLLAILLILWVLQPWLARLTYRHGLLLVYLLVALITFSIYDLGHDMFSPFAREFFYFNAIRYMLLSLIVCGILFIYFRLRRQVLSHALHDARLQVLRARIRPHFLFNSINVVLSIIRTQPKQAETALHDMADMFRMAMSNTMDLSKLQHEIELSKQYIALEQLRMGERLHIEWNIQDLLENALIPPLLLQPLLENAVYHGIELLPQGGCICVTVSHKGDELHLKVENPCPTSDSGRHQGSKMALQNIRERLELLFDVEARYKVEKGRDYYRVEISLPFME
jgi:two-component system sensor histidine kinase AlgZ